MFSTDKVHSTGVVPIGYWVGASLVAASAPHKLLFVGNPKSTAEPKHEPGSAFITMSAGQVNGAVSEISFEQYVAQLPLLSS